MKRILIIICAALGILLIAAIIAAYSFMKSIPEGSFIPTDYGFVLDTEEYNGHTYTLLEVITGIADKAHFLGLYADLDPESATRLDGQTKYTVDTDDALWLQYDDDIMFAELDLQAPAIIVMHSHAEREINELSRDILIR